MNDWSLKWHLEQVQDVEHISQHKHGTPNPTWEFLSKFCNRMFLQPTVTLNMYSVLLSIYLSVVVLCSKRKGGVKLSLPARPLSDSKSLGESMCITWSTLGQSIPILNATVAITVRRFDLSVNALMISFTTGAVQIVYISVSWNLGRGLSEISSKLIPGE